MSQKAANRDQATIDGFGEEWNKFDQSEVSEEEMRKLFSGYFQVFKWNLIDRTSVGFDMGCGSGRWAKLLAPRVGHLHCIDASAKALAVARQNLSGLANVTLHHAGVDEAPLSPGSMDFGISLGVLHHLPDTEAAIGSCAKLLRPGAPFLLYLYYRFDNRPAWFRAVWAVSDVIRRAISAMPFRPKLLLTQLMAAIIYWPLARLSLLLESLHLDVSNIPLSSYRSCSYYTMKTDALDRFGTRIEHRFTRAEINAMLVNAGFENIEFCEDVPFWTVCATKR